MPERGGQQASVFAIKGFAEEINCKNDRHAAQQSRDANAPRVQAN